MNEYCAWPGLIKRFHLIMSTKQTSLLNFGFILKTHKTWLKRTILVHYFQLNLLLHKLPFQVAAYLGSLYPDHFKMNSHQDPFAFQCQRAFAEPRYPVLMPITFAAESTVSKWEPASFTLMLGERNCRFIKQAAPPDCWPWLHKVIGIKYKGKKLRFQVG